MRFFQYVYVLLFFSTLVIIGGAKVDECCRANEVPDLCVRTLCYPLKPPSDFEVYEIFQKKHNCSKHLPAIAQCLADGRDHSHCCRQEAKDHEENACFGVCEGQGKTTKSWAHYQTCLAINLPAMFQCFQKGYETSPSPPQRLRLDSIEQSAVLLSWDEPEHNADQIYKYRVTVSEQIDESEHSLFDLQPSAAADEEEAANQSQFLIGVAPKSFDIDVEGENSVRVENLEPGTLYSASIISLGATRSQRSLSSDKLDFQTAGIAPRVRPYKDVVRTPVGTPSTVIACRFHMSRASESNVRLFWEHKSPNSDEYNLLAESDHYNFSHYTSAFDRPREYIMTLEVKEITAADFGLYRCIVEDKYGRATADVQLAVATLGTADSKPPATPQQCCESRGVESRCMSMCGATETAEVKRYVPRPFMPANCSVQISKVLSCAMPGVDDGECCLLGRVPRACFYLCDSSVAPNNFMDPLCIQHMKSVEKCRVAGVERRPSTVLSLKAHTQPAADLTTLQWEPTDGAEAYHIYWRRQFDTQWQQKTTTMTSKRLNGGADEIVVVAANSHGISQPTRIAFHNSKWIHI